MNMLAMKVLITIGFVLLWEWPFTGWEVDDIDGEETGEGREDEGAWASSTDDDVGR